MLLKQIELQHYRNYEHIQLQTSQQVNVFEGMNAQGKTNLLEAILVLALTKSHRTSKDKELIHWNGEEARITANIEKKYGPCKLELMINQQGKRAKLNGLEQKKLSGFVGALNVVMFAPEDLEIVKGSPAIRRRFLDMEIAQVQPSYLHALTQYQKVISQRNHLLKQAHSQPPTSQMQSILEVYNEQFMTLGVKIMKKRQSFIEKLQQWAQSIHAGITNNQEQLTLTYLPSIPMIESTDEAMLFNHFVIKLTEIKDQEWRRGTSLIGPHRDDIGFAINGKQVQTYGSQGQQRTTALSLKLAEIELMHQEIGEYPILLLDDVLSELDQFRQTQLIETFQNKVQTFITTTSLESIDVTKLSGMRVFHVQDGHILQ